MRCWVLNGWAAGPAAWSLCRFPRERIFSYTEELAEIPEQTLAAASEPVLLVGWSMGGLCALRLALRHPELVAGLVLVATTPRMMAAEGWKGMTPRRLEALRRGFELTRGEGLFGLPPGRPNPYLFDGEENLRCGLELLGAVDLRAELTAAAPGWQFPVRIFQSERDPIVHPDNAHWFQRLLPQSELTWVSGAEHALPVTIPALIDRAVTGMVTHSAPCARL